MDVVRQRSGSQKELSSNKGLFFCRSFLFLIFLLLKSHVFFVIFSCFFFLFSIMNLYHKSHRFDFFVSSVRTRHFAVADREKKSQKWKNSELFSFLQLHRTFFFKIFKDVHEIRHLSHNYSSSLIIIIMALFRFPTFYM